MSSAGSARISPTAYATGYFWYRHGLSHPALATPQGRRIDHAFRAMLAGTRLVGGVSLTALMLARHRGIDAVLSKAIEEGRVGQVIEIAAGLSPRGWDFMRRYGKRLTYVETDLPQMAALKKKLLGEAGLLRPRHRVVELDALADRGTQSLQALAKSLNPKLGTAVITEGLMNYLDPDTAQGVWRRIAKTLAPFPHGVYLSDLYLKPEQVGVAVGMFGLLLSAFVRGRMHVHFRTEEEAVAIMKRCGFADAMLHKTADLPETQQYAATPGGDRVYVLEARS